MTEEEILEFHRIIQPFEAAKGKFEYFPHRKIQEWMLQPHVNLFIHGANQSGKSTACVIYVVSMCEGWHPAQKPSLVRLVDEAVDDWVKRQAEYLLENKLWLPSPPIMARCVGNDFPNFIDKVLGPEYIKWATAADLKDIAYDNEKRRKITWKNKSYVEFMTYQQEVIAHAGAKFHVIHLDEEPSQGHYQQSMMRISIFKGRIICGMTAEKGVSWTKQHVFDPAAKGDPNFYAIKLSAYDNPIMTAEMINKLRATCLSKVEEKIRIDGEMVPRGGSIFEQWVDDYPFVIDPFEIPKEGGMLIMAIDPHPQHPHMVSWVWLDVQRQTNEKFPVFENLPYMFVCAELSEKCNAKKLASWIEIKEKHLGRKHDIAICDPRGWQKSQEDENARSLVEQLNDYGINPIMGSKKLIGGLVKLGECLELDFDITLSAKTREVEKIRRDFPQMMIFDTMEIHRFELKNYRWQPPPMTRAGESKDAPEKPVDKDDHSIENIRRIVEWARDQQFEIFDSPEYSVENLKFTSGGRQIDLRFEEEESMLIGA